MSSDTPAFLIRPSDYAAIRIVPTPDTKLGGVKYVGYVCPEAAMHDDALAVETGKQVFSNLMPYGAVIAANQLCQELQHYLQHHLW